MDTLLHDLRFATRTLRRNRGFTLAAVVCLALGVGVNTATFSVVNAILLRPLPFVDGERVVSLHATNELRGIEEGGLTYADLEAWRESRSLEEVAGLARRSFTLTGGEEAERVEGSSVTPNLFSLLGVQPRLGRGFRPEEGQPAGFEPVVILSDDLWRRRFAADEGIVGRTVLINDRELVVVGVMPAGFGFPERDRLWVPLGVRNEDRHSARFIWGIGRLRAGTSVAQAERELDAVAVRLAGASPATHRHWGVRVLGYRDDLVDPNAQRLLHLMLGAVGFVLLIACANVANLLLAQATYRGREIAVRAAIGASRARLVRQLLTESILVALAGGALGVWIAVWWVDAMAGAIPEEMAYWIRLDMDERVLLYTLALSVATGLLFGTLPALEATRPGLSVALKEAGRASSGGRRRHRIRGALVVGQIGLSLVLLVGAALMVQSFLRLQRADPGFQAERMLSLRVYLAGDRYDPIAARASLLSALAERIGAIPGVAGAAATSSIPADDGGCLTSVGAKGEEPLGERAVAATLVGSSGGLWSALGIPLLRGRDFTPQEVADSQATVAIVGRSLADRLWPEGDALGQRIGVGRPEGPLWYTVVGVAPDLQYEEFGEETLQTRLQLHVPYARVAARQMALLVRARGEPAALTRAVRDEIRALDARVAPFEVMTRQARRRFTTWPQRIFGSAFGMFGGIALVLALVGVFGVTAYAVAQRRRELAVRIALGARPRDVLRLVIGQGARLALLGAGLGVVGAFALMRLMRGILFGVSVSDPVTFVGVALLLVVATLLASYLPARRATRVDPMVVLRAE